MNIDKLTIDTIRVISAEAIQKANSGHPGLPLGCAPMAYTLWAKHLKHNPKNSNWIDRDRFVLSAGHGSMLIYSLLNIFGYDVSMEDIKNFRQYGSKTAGHPEYKHIDGVETTTGPLGQGICNAVGMAISEAYLAEKFNKEGFNVVDHYTYTIAGDGCLMEGISSEASSLAGTLELGKLIMLYDSNNISIEGDTDIAFREDVAKRYDAYGWQVINVADGNNVEEISKAIEEAKKEKKKPSIIIVKNIIGFGCVAKQGKASAHGEPLGEDNIKAMKEGFGWKHEPFTVPEEVKENMESFNKDATAKEKAWNDLFESYKNAYPELAKEWGTWFNGKLSTDILNDKDFWSFDKPMATRESSGILINRLTKLIPNLIGGSADLAPSNKTYMKDRGDFSAEDRSGANLHFGVREHAMAAIGNGIYLHGGLRVFVSTFFVFSDYMKGAMRLSAIMGLPITYVLTHDSIGVGEDGPTHEPIEHLAALRSMPNMTVFRPADSKETAAGWYLSLTKEDGPVSLVLTRQKLPLYDNTGKEALKGAYILKDSIKEVPDMILMASGSEVELIYKAAEELKKNNIDARVVSVPSFELFEEQSSEYKESIFPRSVRSRIAVEAATSFGWHKYVGLDGDVISIDHFGASGKAEVLFETFGFTVDNVVKKALELKK
ncbi:transketolase [Clostridium algidicarnis]|uniref:transketolase n=1 Tax=Clostridium algidicarnis TaxID=37659 RepID=UPI001C0B225E|nr:transketolase [Clostridium algidicarnis]MBU3204101.1 transketolase [Clostridium algidicarnis]MBU3212255.1 transketolase [Clostridium algidicarnis]MBU3221240.1 transketolase [Clostridium algidicarnis]